MFKAGQSKQKRMLRNWDRRGYAYNIGIANSRAWLWSTNSQPSAIPVERWRVASGGVRHSCGKGVFANNLLFTAYSLYLRRSSPFSTFLSPLPKCRGLNTQGAQVNISLAAVMNFIVDQVGQCAVGFIFPHPESNVYLLQPFRGSFFP